jgi:tetratricopeptide (TPR) repeat protein
LETLRQYGQERLDQEGERDRWRRRHAHHFAAFAAEVGRGLRGRDELVWRERLLGDLDNLRAAVIWGLDTGVEEDQQTAVAIIAWLAYESMNRATGIGRWAEQAIPALERSAPGYRSAVLGAAAWEAMYRGDFDTAERYARAALEEDYRPDDPCPCLAPFLLTVTHMYADRTDDAARYLKAAEAATAGREDADFLRSWVQSTWVSIRLSPDDEDVAIAEARLAMSLAEGTGNPSNLALASFALGWALYHRHPDEAMAACDRFLALARRGAGTVPLASGLFMAAQAASQGHADLARSRLREGLEEAIRDDSWTQITAGLDTAVDTFWYLGEPRVAAVLAGTIETTLAPLRWPYIASRGPGLPARIANLTAMKETLGDTTYEQAHAEGAAMSRQDAVAYALRHL